MNEQTLRAMREMVKIQGADGNWDYDEYMRGMYNGMELMLSVIENREPVYKEAPGTATKTDRDDKKASAITGIDADFSGINLNGPGIKQPKSKTCQPTRL
ncbi:hypothetical protein [Bacillus licheniformis]|uniref:hypothetical protein n=1 Tax=Bacillus licheniformis TaxID=1402 RepID=UPI002E2437E6|nr:hypothetical protein [Bacillus licheniformis]